VYLSPLFFPPNLLGITLNEFFLKAYTHKDKEGLIIIKLFLSQKTEEQGYLMWQTTEGTFKLLKGCSTRVFWNQ
jgi:hypothetical protein